MNKKYLIITLLHITYPFSLVAQSGILDSTFGNAGITLTPVSRNDVLNAVVIQPNDYIVIAGSTDVSSTELFLARYISSGTLDTTGFNSNGSMPGTQTLEIGTQTQAQAVALQSDDKILVAGFTTQGKTNMFVARYNTDGSIDTNFNSGYATLSVGDGATANAVGLQSTGNIIIAGASVNNESPNFTLARFTSLGVLDSSFGTGGTAVTQIGVTSYIQAMAIQSNDQIVVVGNSDDQITIVRYNADGSLDTSFGTAGIFMPTIGSPATAYDVILDANEYIVVAGYTRLSGEDQSLLLRCTPSGALDSYFGTGGIVTTAIGYGSQFYTLTMEENDGAFDNYIIAAGYAIAALSYDLSIARYTTSGALDSNFGTNGVTTTSQGSFAFIQALGIQSNGESIAAGMSDGTFLLARYTA